MKLIGGGDGDETSMVNSDGKNEVLDIDDQPVEELPDDFDPDKDPLGRFGFGILSFIRL